MTRPLPPPGSVEPTSETAVSDGASADAGASAEGADAAASKLRHVMITGYVRKNINDADAVVDDYYVLDHYAETVYGLRYQAVARSGGGRGAVPGALCLSAVRRRTAEGNGRDNAALCGSHSVGCIPAALRSRWR